MSTLKTNNVQVGQSVTATNNFTIYQPASPDGTVRIGVGNSGATTGDAVTINSTGIVKGTLVSGTAVASTSGTSIDFTGIPSTAKRITVMFSGVSTNSTSIPQIQLGDAGGVETTGYLAMVSNIQTASNTTRGVTATSGFIYLHAGNAASVVNGSITFSYIGSNIWTVSGNLYDSGGAQLNTVSGAKTLSDTLDRVRITTVNGTDTFDAGTINIMWEG